MGAGISSQRTSLACKKLNPAFSDEERAKAKSKLAVVNGKATTESLEYVKTIVAEYKASNGVVYVINGVLIPPQKLQ